MQKLQVKCENWKFVRRINIRARVSCIPFYTVVQRRRGWEECLLSSPVYSLVDWLLSWLSEGVDLNPTSQMKAGFQPKCPTSWARALMTKLLYKRWSWAVPLAMCSNEKCVAAVFYVILDAYKVLVYIRRAQSITSGITKQVCALEDG